MLARWTRTGARRDRGRETDAAPSEQAIAGARALFALVLGRTPEPGIDFGARARRPFLAALADLLLSDEFASQVLRRLIDGETPPHAALGAGPQAEWLRVAAAYAVESPDSRAAADVFAAEHPTWRGFLAQLLTSDGPWRAALDQSRDAAADAFADAAARAVCALRAEPGRGAATKAWLHVGPSGAVQATALILAADPPPGARLRLRDAADPTRDAIADIAWTDEAAENGVTRRRGEATLDGAVLAALGPRGALLDLIDDADDRRPRPLGPICRLSVALEPEERAKRLGDLTARLCGPSQADAADAIEALRRDDPFSADVFTVALERMAATDDAQGLAAAAHPKTHAPSQGSSQGPMAALAQARRRAAMRLARRRGDHQAARDSAAALTSPTRLDQVLSGAAERSAQTAADGLIDARDAAARASATAGLSGRLGIGSNDGAAGAAVLIGALRPASEVADWLAASSSRRRAAALEWIQQSAPAYLIPTLSRLNPALASDAIADFGASVGAARLALVDERLADALAWGLRLAQLADAEPARRADAAQLLRSIAAPAARAAASDLYVALGPIDGAPPWTDAEIVAELEMELLAHDPLRSADRLLAARRRFRRAATRTWLADPGDASARAALARALMLEGRDAEGLALYQALRAERPDDAALHAEAALAAEAAERHEMTAEAADAALSHGAGDRVALAKVRSLRATGGSEAAGRLLEDRLPTAGAALRAEHALNHFFRGDFDPALAAAEQLLDATPQDREARLVAIAAAIELRRWDHASALLEALPPRAADAFAAAEADIDDALFRAAVAEGLGAKTEALGHLNDAFAVAQCGHVGLRHTARFGPDGFSPSRPGAPIERLTRDLADQQDGAPTIGPPPQRGGPLVSVIMTAYDAGPYLETSVRSILQQSYEPLELIIVDDASHDETPERILAFERADPRVRGVLKSTNDGTYVCKNIGLLQARGTFIALQDADDWSHPDRIAKSVAALEAQSDLIGVSTDWIRMTSEGRMLLKPGGRIAHVCCISFVFRRAPALARAGFFDSVRVEADREYIRRLARVFGREAVARLRTPLLIGRAHARSLTAHPEYGIARDGYTAPRRDYQAAYKAWHEEIAAGRADPRLAFPLTARPFSAPSSIAP